MVPRRLEDALGKEEMDDTVAVALLLKGSPFECLQYFLIVTQSRDSRETPYFCTLCFLCKEKTKVKEMTSDRDKAVSYMCHGQLGY
jgi:hypothetical protein